MKREFPRLIVSAPATGSGKTTVTLGLIAALTRRGHVVQPFKVGPDYIDPAFHKEAAGRVSRNLDTWMLSRSDLPRLFRAAAQDAGLSIIEGVMGLFDGFSPDSLRSSTAEMALLLRAPVVLVVDASGMARSVSALVEGFRKFDPRLNIAGVILNRVGGPGHYRILKRALARDTGVKVFGWLPSDPGFSLKERHLGLVPVPELARLHQRFASWARTMEKTVNLDAMIRAARAAPGLSSAPLIVRQARQRIRLAVAYDEAFHFYYPDSLDVLHALGAEWVRFSPLKDPDLPGDIHGVLFGGGFPEVHARRLADNASMKRDLRNRIGRGLPVYAECGGLMYLVERLRDSSGKDHDMVGVIPGRVEMTRSLQRFGYAIGKTLRPSILGGAGLRVRGHEFHYSTWSEEGRSKHSLYEVRHPREKRGRREGYATRTIAATYLHIHLAAYPGLARAFVRKARGFATADPPSPRAIRRTERFNVRH